MPNIIATEEIASPLQQSELSKKSLCDYVINVASGCLHRCTFCYVPSTPAIRTRANNLKERGVNNPQLDWGTYLFVRQDVPEKVEATLKHKRSWNHSPGGQGVVLLCSGTDPYQNKATAEVTRETIKVLLKHNKRVRILTRSPLWVSDLDILVHPNVTVGMSLPHLDDELSRQIEPGAPRPSDRLLALKKGKAAGCRVFVAIAPTVPTNNEFHQYFDSILSLSPEVMFWEPINARGTNGARMKEAGIEWVEQISTGKLWAANFMNQWHELEAAALEMGCLNLIHPWFDPNLKTYIPAEDWWMKWFNRPTVEK